MRMIGFLAGFGAAVGASQFPEFSQQYVQRLGGAVDALEQVVADFDASAQAEGLSRSEALEELTGTGFADRRRADMIRTIARKDALHAQLTELETAGPFTRAYHAARMDGEVARAALQAYEPAIPFTTAGAMFSGAGFVGGWAAVATLLAVLRGLWPFGRAGRVRA